MWMIIIIMMWQETFVAFAETSQEVFPCGQTSTHSLYSIIQAVGLFICNPETCAVATTPTRARFGGSRSWI